MLKLKLLYHSLCSAAVFVLAGSMAGCAAETSQDDEPGVDSTRQAVSAVKWRKVKKRGGACKFESDADGPADAFVIANGQDISIVFTNLGAATKNGPQGRVYSRCNFEIPVGVPTGQYVSGWHQMLNYGAVKPAGIAAGLGLSSALDSTPGGALPLPPIDVRFARDAETNIAFDTAMADLVIDPSQPHQKTWRKQACKHSGRDVTYVGEAFVWTERAAAGSEVIIAVDGVDARFDLAATVQPCPTNA